MLSSQSANSMEGSRTITVNFQQQQRESQRYPSNKISSTRYTWYSFLPIALLIQFSKVSNTFYAIGAILQSIPEISTNDPLATIIPLAYVIAVGVLKEALADLKRYKSDNRQNRHPCTLVVREEGGHLGERVVPTQDLRVGDVVRLRDGDIVPADLLLLTTKDAQCEAFNKTASLDGETNLKLKLALRSINETILTNGG